MTLSNELKEIIETDSAVYALSIDSDRTTATAFADGAEYALINKAVYEAAGLVKKDEWNFFFRIDAGTPTERRPLC